MRITCPDCGAQYEIEASLIPAAGRDVQCSACDTVWSQKPGPDSAAPDNAASSETGDRSADETAPATASGEDAPRPRLDENTRKILREEARREALERRRKGTHDEPEPAEPAEPLPDPTDNPATASDADAARKDPHRARNPAKVHMREDSDPPLTASLRQRPERSRATASPAAPSRDTGPARPRTDLLPDADESGASITGPAARPRGTDPAAPAPEPEGSGGFLSGFAFVLIVAIILVAIYLAAPVIAGRIPAMEDELASYVGLVNDLRLRIDLVLQSLAGFVSGLVA